MLIDAFQPEGVTRLAVDSIFMMPHLGLLSTIDEQAAADVFDRDCLVDLGTCVAPVGRGSIGTPCLSYELTLEGETTSGVLETGSLHLIPCEQSATLSVTPEKGWDVGADPGQALETVIPGGKVGLILDGRGRPIEFTADEIRHQTVSDWAEALSLYS